MSLFDIALSGLRASEYAKHITASNISNANNPFYTRRGVEFTEFAFGQFGGGVNIGDVRRIVDSMADQQLLDKTFDISQKKTLYERLSYLETFIDNKDSSVSKFINESLNALDSLNATPGSIQGRNHYLNQLDNMAHRFQDVDKRLKSDIGVTKNEIGASLDQANHILEKLSELNKKIAAENGQQDTTKMALYDQRDKYLSELGGLIDFEYQVNEHGQLDIQLNNGLSLLVDNRPAKLTMMQGNPKDIDIGIETKNGITRVNDFFSSGSIRGLMDFHATLKQSEMQLDRIAMTIAHQLNSQNQLGVDANGALGGRIFTDINDPALAASRVTAETSNTGSAVMRTNVSSPELLKDSEYELSFDSATHYNLVRKSDGETVGSGDVLGFPHRIDAEGFSVTIDSGSFTAGDSYNISPAKNAARQLNMAMNNGEKLALGWPVITSASKTNQGDGDIQLEAVIDTATTAFSQPKQLNPPVRVEFITSTSYRLVNANDNSIIEDNLAYDPTNGGDVFPSAGGYDPGYRVKLSGQMKAGDSFNINYNADGLGDNRNGMKLADLYRQSGDFPGFSRLYQGFEFDISSATNAASVNFEASNILFEQAQMRRDEASSVSLMEEMMNMSRYQEFYMANAQVMDTVSQTMDTLFGLLRR